MRELPAALGAALSWAALGAGAFTLAFALACAAAALALRRLLERAPAAGAAPPVTVIKPLKGDDGSLYENLATFCRQDHPCSQLLLCVSSSDDPALGAAARLRRDFPAQDVEIVVSSARIGYNPKVNNMANAYSLAKYDLILMSDADVRVPSDFLRRMAAPFADPAVGLVTAFYQAGPSRGLWGLMEALSINAQFLPQALCAAAFGMRFAMGAAMMVRRRAFEAAGGFPSLADHLADDFWLGECVREAGWRVEMAPAVADSMPDISGGLEHFRHLARWARTIRLCQPAGYAASVVSHGFSLLLLRLLALGPDAAGLGLLGAIWAAKAAAAALIAREAGGRQPLRALWLLPLSEAFSFSAWAAGFASDRVLWRGQVYEVRERGRLVPVAAAPSPLAAAAD